HSRHSLVRGFRARGDRLAARRRGGDLHSFAAQHPPHVVTVLEGESLVNDASGLVIYKFAVVAVLTGAFSLWEASVQFVGVAVGGVVIGVVMGRLFVFIHRYLGDAFIEVLTTLAVPYVTYIIAES